PIPGAALPGVLTSDDLLADAGRHYERLIILGGGVIGMELASVYAARGTRVTVLEALDRPLANFDREISQNLKMILKKRGADIHTGARVTQIEGTPEGLLCAYTEKDAPQAVAGDAVLLAAGRRPNTEGLFGPGLDPQTNRGYLIVNDAFETSLPGVYAIGDVTGGIQLAHAAFAQARVFAALLCGETPSIRLDLVPSCVYTDPEIACVGLDEAAAKAQGRAVRTRKYVMGANGKSVLTLQERGFIKAVLDAETDALLGAQLMCAHATDMVSEFTLAVARGLTGKELGGIIRPHPTFEEAAGELFAE
ncbi:MAG TPA: FAD-dependent oxidoreductase, partial [Oscillospiraceae bacterium]|nr:FAD-dependent oxidoreductase [Oscillospiraceae bacterium]